MPDALRGNATTILVTGEMLDATHIGLLKEAGFSPTFCPTHLDSDALVDALQGVSGYILGGVEHVREDVLSQCPDLRIIAVLGVGYDVFVDVEAATALGIAVTNTPDTNARSVAELTIALLLDVERRVSYSNAEAKRGHTAQVLAREISRSRIGIVGMGAIGSSAAQILRFGFDADICYYSPTRKPGIERELGATALTLPALLEESDAVLLCARSSRETDGLIGEDELHRMRPTTVLINTARPMLVDGHALYAALTKRQIAAAAFDGYYTEPLPSPADDPYRLLSLPDDRFIVTPHIGAFTRNAVSRMNAKAVASLTSFLRSGTAEHIVNPAFASQTHMRGHNRLERL